MLQLAQTQERKLDTFVPHESRGGGWRGDGLGRAKCELNSCTFLVLIPPGKEIKKSKLIRSQSFNNQAFHAKYGNLDKCPRYDLSTIHVLTQFLFYSSTSLFL